MSIATAPADSQGGVPGPGRAASAPGESCPLCGAPLHPEQEWCLRCGAAARTRLAASPNWRTPLLGAIVVAVLSLGVLAAALVKLAGDTGPATPPTTRTLTTTPPSALAPPTTAVPSTPTVTTTAPAAPGASTPTTTPTNTTQSKTGATLPPGSSAAPQKTPAKGLAGLSPALSKRLLELSRRQGGKGK